MSVDASADSTDLTSDTERVTHWLLHAASGKFGALLAAILALMLSSPLILRGQSWSFLISVFAAGVLVAGLHAAKPGWRSLRIGIVLALTDFTIGRITHLDGTRWLVFLQIVLWLCTLGFVIIRILDSVFERRSVTVETLQAALCVYLLLGLLWAYVYAIVSLVSPSSFAFQGVRHIAWTDEMTRRIATLRLIVYSYATLSSAGYIEVTPATAFTNLCASLQAMSGQVYLAVVIARLVGLQAAAPPPHRRTRLPRDLPAASPSRTASEPGADPACPDH